MLLNYMASFYIFLFFIFKGTVCFGQTQCTLGGIERQSEKFYFLKEVVWADFEDCLNKRPMPRHTFSMDKLYLETFSKIAQNSFTKPVLDSLLKCSWSLITISDKNGRIIAGAYSFTDFNPSIIPKQQLEDFMCKTKEQLAWDISYDYKQEPKENEEFCFWYRLSGSAILRKYLKK